MPEILGINTIYILFYLMIGCTIALVASIFDILKAHSKNELEAEVFFNTIMNAFFIILFYPIPLCLSLLGVLVIYTGEFFEKVSNLFKSKKQR